MAGDEPGPALVAAGTAATSLRVPQLEHRLQGQINYAEWIIAIELTLSMYPIGAMGYCNRNHRRRWANKSRFRSSNSRSNHTGRMEEIQQFRTPYHANQQRVRHSAKFGLSRQAHEAYVILKTEFEGKTLTDIGPVLTGVIKLEFDDRKTTIEEHISEYERWWNFMISSLNGSEFSGEKKGFGEGLTRIADNDAAKAEFLLLTMSPYLLQCNRGKYPK